MKLTRPSVVSALGGILAVSMMLAVPARAQEGDDLGGMVTKSLAAMNADKWEEALAILTNAINRFGKVGKPAELFGPQFGVLYYRKGVCEMKLKRWMEAMKSFETCYRDFPNAGGKAAAAITSTRKRSSSGAKPPSARKIGRWPSASSKSSSKSATRPIRMTPSRRGRSTST